MPAAHDIWPGRRVTLANLAELIEGRVIATPARDVCGPGLALVVGIPGAFSPVCSNQHIPSLVANADRLRKSGLDRIICIVASDPFVLKAWAAIIDPLGKVRFVSDGNLDFARSLGLVARETALFLGDRSERYMMTVRAGVIETMRVERNLIEYQCTRPDDLYLEDA